MRNFLIIIFFNSFLITNSMAQCVVNYLQNPGFEVPAQTGNGNHFPVTVPSWTFPSGQLNLIKVDGSDYYGGPNTANEGTQYLDIVSASGSFEQTFTTFCVTSITFSGAFSSREIGRTWDAKIEIVNSSNVVVATSNVRTFTTADADNNVPPGPDAVWYTLSGSATNIPAGTYSYRVSLDDYGNFDNAFLCLSPGCLLPITLATFSVANNDCQSQIFWTTANEINAAYFDVESSNDGVNYTKQHTIAATGGANGKSYTVNVEKLNAVSTYYRLKMVDKDGKFSYSEILKLRNNCHDLLLSVYPNPTQDRLVINVSGITVQTPVTISNSIGQVVKQFFLKNGSTVIGVVDLPKGIYYLNAVTAGEKKAVKFTKE